MDNSPPSYRHLQSTFSGRFKKERRLKSESAGDSDTASPQQLDAMPVKSQAATPRSFVEVTAQVSSGTSTRTWLIQKSLLIRHSRYFQERRESRRIEVAVCSLSQFQNFVDFVHSNIYSVNKGALDYHVIHTHLQAWLLGSELEAPAYHTAALCELYTWFEPIARAANGSAAHSSIRIEDVDLVCRETSKGCVLRALVFDAIAAHWKREEAYSLASNSLLSSQPNAHPDSGRPLTWKSLYTNYTDFGERMRRSTKILDHNRTHLLRPLGDYLIGKTHIKEEEFVPKIKVEPSSPSSWLKSRSSRPSDKKTDIGGYMRSPSRRRRSSSASSKGEQRAASWERHVDEDEFITDGDV